MQLEEKQRVLKIDQNLFWAHTFWSDIYIQKTGYNLIYSSTLKCSFSTTPNITLDITLSLKKKKKPRKIPHLSTGSINKRPQQIFNIGSNVRCQWEIEREIKFHNISFNNQFQANTT